MGGISPSPQQNSIDAHFHCLAADTDLAKVEAMAPSLLAQHARHLLEAALRRGFTTVRDAAGADYGYAAAVESGLIRGPRIFYAGKALTQTGGHGDFRGLETTGCCACAAGGGTFSIIADGVSAVRRAAREELRKGASQIKIMASGGVSSPRDPIDNLQYSEEEIRAIVWEARSWGRYVMAHAYSAEAIRRCVAFGVRSIEHANLIDAETAAFCAEKGAFVVPTLAAYDGLARDGKALGFPDWGLEKLDKVLEAGRQSLDILRSAGVKLGFGSDLLGGLQRYQSNEFLIRREVLSAEEILISATSGNARLLQAEGSLGVVRVGALADLIAVDGDPFRDLGLLQEDGARIPLIIKDGDISKNAL